MIDIVLRADLIERLKAADGYGALHVVIEDGNIDDDCILSCLADPAIDEDEASLGRALLLMTEDEREALFIEAGIAPDWWFDA